MLRKVLEQVHDDDQGTDAGQGQEAVDQGVVLQVAAHKVGLYSQVVVIKHRGGLLAAGGDHLQLLVHDAVVVGMMTRRVMCRGQVRDHGGGGGGGRCHQHDSGR